MTEYELLGVSSLIALGSLMCLLAIKFELRSRRAYMRGYPFDMVCTCTHYAWEHDYYTGLCKFKTRISSEVTLECICLKFKVQKLFTILDEE